MVGLLTVPPKLILNEPLAVLEDELHFPFEATVMGERLQVIGMDSERNTLYGGMMVMVAKKQAAYAFPLTELTAS